MGQALLVDYSDLARLYLVVLLMYCRPPFLANKVAYHQIYGHTCHPEAEREHILVSGRLPRWQCTDVRRVIQRAVELR